MGIYRTFGKTKKGRTPWARDKKTGLEAADYTNPNSLLLRDLQAGA
jgi:hypothetical protein